MAEATIRLTLNGAQRSQVFAHLLTYLFHLAAHPSERRVKADMEIIQEVTYRLFQKCLETSEESVFQLSLKEGLMVRSAFLYLKDLYKQHMQAESSALALEHLSVCLSLLQEAKQQALSNGECEAVEEGERGQATDADETTIHALDAGSVSQPSGEQRQEEKAARIMEETALKSRKRNV